MNRENQPEETFSSAESQFFKEGESKSRLKAVESWQGGQNLALEKLEAPPGYSELSPKEKFEWASGKLGQVNARLEHFTAALSRVVVKRMKRPCQGYWKR